ncbi:hypothetical protein TNCV_4322771 [Trichonephila clavipes]|nr:hypothetical protein TNCV_4322771 [Trichonephila clavipes]
MSKDSKEAMSRLMIGRWCSMFRESRLGKRNIVNRGMGIILVGNAKFGAEVSPPHWHVGNRQGLALVLKCDRCSQTILALPVVASSASHFRRAKISPPVQGVKMTRLSRTRNALHGS